MPDLHGWQSDPFGVHEQRYFSQGQPTKLVRDGDAESYDPPPTHTAPEAQAPEVAHAPGSGPALESMSVTGGEGKQANATTETPALLPVPPRPGWWLASDGNWYPPETHPDATETGLGWWLASDGNWYPPETHPDFRSTESVGDP